MRLVNKLVDAVHDAFDRSALPTDAITAQPNQNLAFALQDDVIQVTVSNMVIDQIPVGGKTLQDVADRLAAYCASVTIVSGQETRAARTLVAARETLDDDGVRQVVLLSYTSSLWMLMDAFAVELEAARQAVYAMLEQLFLQSAAADWLDEWGGYFGLKRFSGEVDYDFRQRITVSMFRQKCNNVALEIALAHDAGIEVSVVDRATPGVFSVTLPFDIFGAGQPDAAIKKITTLINNIKAAGTQLGDVSLTDSIITDAVMDTALSDLLTVTIAHHYVYDGKKRHNGAIQYGGDGSVEVWNDE